MLGQGGTIRLKNYDIYLFYNYFITLFITLRTCHTLCNIRRQTDNNRFLTILHLGMAARILPVLRIARPTLLFLMLGMYPSTTTMLCNITTELFYKHLIEKKREVVLKILDNIIVQKTS